METLPKLALTGLGVITLLVSGCAGTSHYRMGVQVSPLLTARPRSLLLVQA